MPARPCFAVLLWLAVLAVPAAADDDDFYISIPSDGTIYRIDSDTLDMTPWATGLSIPFYGVWATDGFLYMPDRGYAVVFKIDAAGNAVPFAAGGYLSSPVTLAQAPDGTLVVSDIFQNAVVALDGAGAQTLVHDATTSGGLIDGPGGLAFDPDGVLYVANTGAGNVVAIEPGGAISLVSDDALLAQAGGIAADGAGNLFVASYENDLVARVRLPSGETEVFADDPILLRPNDVKLTKGGGLLVTTRSAALVHIDALGTVTILKQDRILGEWDGVAVPQDHPPCSGRFTPYGAGTPGTGGVVPELSGIFSPCAGAAAALEMRAILPGANGLLLWGLGEGSFPAEGGVLLVDLLGVWNLIPLSYGPTGRMVLPFTLPANPAIVGLDLYMQALASDPGAPYGWSMSNGLRESIGG